MKDSERYEVIKKHLLHMQKEILESKGSFILYLVLLILTLAVVGAPEIPILAYMPRLVITFIGLGYLLPIYILFKQGRTKAQNRALHIYMIALTALAVSTVIKMM